MHLKEQCSKKKIIIPKQVEYMLLSCKDDQKPNNKQQKSVMFFNAVLEDADIDTVLSSVEEST